MMQPKSINPSPQLSPLLERLPELDRQLWDPLIKAIEQLPTRERDSFVALVHPIISMHLSRLTGVEQLETITANQGERLKDLANLRESLWEQLQNNRNEMSHLKDILVRFGISPNEEE